MGSPGAGLSTTPLRIAASTTRERIIVNQTVRGSLTYTVTPSRPTNARRTPNATACTSSQTPRPGAPGLGAASVADHDSSGRSDPQSARYQLLSPADIAYAYKLSRKTIYRAIERLNERPTEFRQTKRSHALINANLGVRVVVLVRWSGLVWSGLIWSGLVWSDLIWSGLV